MGYKHVIPEFIMNLKEMKKNSIFTPKGDITATRAFCYVSDLVDGLKILEKSDVTKEIFHIGNDKEVSILELLKMIEQHMNLKIKISDNFLSEHSGSAIRRCPDITKIKNHGYEPKISLENGLKNTIKWYVENKKIQKMYI